MSPIQAIVWRVLRHHLYALALDHLAHPPDRQLGGGEAGLHVGGLFRGDGEKEAARGLRVEQEGPS